jgi:undecaprenyl-diphosphatase
MATNPPMPLWLVIILLGLIEGATEFLPVSSTGHLVVADRLFGFHLLIGEEQAAVFKIFIQSGAVLSIVALYWERLQRVATLALRPAGGAERRLVWNLLAGFLPVAVVGLFAYDAVESLLSSTQTVAWALIVGGFIMLGVERLRLVPRVHDVDKITIWQATAVGLAQVLSLIPGTSRAAATMVGGMGAGMDRRTATEFSFLLGLPVLLASGGYSLLKRLEYIDPQMIGALLLGAAVSFVSAYVVMKWLLRFVQRHTFDAIAWYRIGLGAALLVLVGAGWIQ